MLLVLLALVVLAGPPLVDVTPTGAVFRELGPPGVDGGRDRDRERDVTEAVEP